MAEQELRPTLVVNIFGAPGSGKTTTAWEIAETLRHDGYLVEFAPEYAKELTWNQTSLTLPLSERMEASRLLDGQPSHQLQLATEQQKRIERCIGQVDIVVTDSPTLLGLLYMDDSPSVNQNDYDDAHEFMTRAQREVCVSNNNLICTSLNMRVFREGQYETIGRNQNEAEALLLDTKLDLLIEDYVPDCYYLNKNIDIENIIECIKESYSNNYRQVADYLSNNPYEATRFKDLNKQYTSAVKDVLQDKIFYNMVTGELLISYLQDEETPELYFYDAKYPGELIELIQQNFIGKADRADDVLTKDADQHVYNPAHLEDKATIIEYASEIALNPECWMPVEGSIQYFVDNLMTRINRCCELSPVTCHQMSTRELAKHSELAYALMDTCSNEQAPEWQLERSIAYIKREQEFRGVDCFDKEMSTGIRWHYADMYKVNEGDDTRFNSLKREEIENYCKNNEYNFTELWETVLILNEKPGKIQNIVSNAHNYLENLLRTYNTWSDFMAEEEAEPAFKMMLQDTIDLGWTIQDVSEYGSELTIDLQQYSPLGEDYSFTVVVDKDKQAESYANEVRTYADNFLPDSHVAMWIEDRGTRGIPDSIKELAEDANAIEQMNNELADTLVHDYRVYKQDFEEFVMEEKEELTKDEPKFSYSPSELLSQIKASHGNTKSNNSYKHGKKQGI